MSPYRVLVFTGREHMILAAMLSIDQLVGNRNIYIIQKAVPSDTILSDKAVAHLQSCKRNSVILDKYEILKEFEDRRTYRVRKSSSLGIIEGSEMTQQDCLKLAMHDYCERNNLTIISTL